ncbi:MAG: M14 family metallopeptidase [Chloroherpetonaceae bacterium]|nr:M14 family metallopeptidase [Chloroherpetonaceae bacterium]
MTSKKAKTNQRKSPALLTVAEKTNYTATSRFADVETFLFELKSLCPQMSLTTFGSTTEGRPLYLAVFSNTNVRTPIDAIKSGKPIVLLQNNIHAGEVCPKEASMILMRDIAFGNLNELLEKLVILVVPVYNADGNERISEANRLSQIGPENGVGIRTNAIGLDLNRDYMKIEAKETLHLIRDLYVAWQPDVIVDGHTTDGSRHGYDLTYGFPQNPNANKGLIEFTRDIMLPEVSEKIKKDTGIDMFFYADFVDFKNPSAGWATYSHHARYGAAYGGLQNRISILMETYSYVSFKKRVVAAYHFMRECLEYSARNDRKIRDIVSRAERDAVRRGENYDENLNRIGIEIKKVAFDKKVSVIGYEIAERKNPDGSVRYEATKKKKVYEAPYFGKYEMTKTVTRPLGYFIPKAERRIVEKLLLHGIVVETLLREFRIKCEFYDVKSVKASEQCFQAHREVTVEVERKPITLTLNKDDFYVPMNQVSSHVVAGLLEPDSDDSLAHWNYFDNYLTGKLRFEKDFVTEYEYNLIDLPRTKEIYEKLIDKNPSLNEERKKEEKMKFFWTAVGYGNEFNNIIPVYRQIEKKVIPSMLFNHEKN